MGWPGASNRSGTEPPDGARKTRWSLDEYGLGNMLGSTPKFT